MSDYDFLTMDAVAGTVFRATAETDALAREVKDALGFGAFNIPGRLAIARSLALADAPPKVEGELGRPIKGDTLFGVGPDLAAWLSLLIERHGRVPESMKDLHALVASHWARGMKMLADDLHEAGRDASEFWRRLAESALPEIDPDGGVIHGNGGFNPVTGEISLQVGEIARDTSTDEVMVWKLNASGGSPHSALMGGVGSGKTRTATFMLRSLAQQSGPAPLIAFDFKGDLDDERNALGKAFNAKVINPLREPVPLDVFSLPERSSTDIALAAQRFCDSLGNLKESGYTQMQRERLGDALEQALRSSLPCTLRHVQEAVKDVYASKNVREDSVTSNMANLNKFRLFEPRYSPSEFFSRSWIISLPADVPELIRVTIVSLLTDALERYINSLQDAPTDGDGNRSLRSVCVIDEAHRILGARLPALSNLVRLGRSKGAAVMLISQKPDDFDVVDDDFLAEMGLIACFSTNAKPAQVKRILGGGVSLGALKKGEALVKMRGEVTARRLVCWE